MLHEKCVKKRFVELLWQRFQTVQYADLKLTGLQGHLRYEAIKVVLLGW